MLKQTYLLQDDSALKDKIFQKTKLRLSSAALPAKIIDAIVSMGFVLENPDYYISYPYLFKDAFAVDDETLDLLSVAGFLYYRSTMAIDGVFDNKNSDGSFDQYIIANICQEQTIAILSRILGGNKVFWQSWTRRKLEYIKAYQIDFNPNNEIKTFDEFLQLADLKSAIGKISLDALNILSTPKTDRIVYQNLLDSHRYFYGAFQILDDLYDFEEDTISGQANVARTILFREYPNSIKYPLKEQKECIYTKGIADLLYDKALGFIDKSLVGIEKYNVPRWKSEIQSLHNTIVIHRSNVFGYLFHSKKKQINDYDKKEFTSQKDSIQSAKLYLERSFVNDNGWKDYLNGAGVSDVWVSYFVRFFYHEAFPDDRILENGDPHLSLKSESGKRPLLGYNKYWIPDADTTSFYILSRYIHDGVIENEVLEEWLGYQNRDGGFRTYNNDEQLYASLNDKSASDVSGWLSSHFCVSAVAFYAMCRLNLEIERKSALRGYLLNSITNGYYQSYWWCSPVYGLSFIVLSCSVENDKPLLEYSVDLIKDEFQKNPDLKENSFFPALYFMHFPKPRKKRKWPKTCALCSKNN